MAKEAINWESVPAVLRHERELRICLKCGFDLFTRQLGLAARTAYSEMKKFVPAVEAFTAPQRPLFSSIEAQPPCPYCGAAARWIARLRLIQIEAPREAAKPARSLLAALKKRPEEYTIIKDRRAPIELFSDWLERTSLGLNFEGEMWLRDAAILYLERRDPLADWSGIENVSRVLPSRRLEEGWEREGNRIYLAPALYGDLLVIQYLLSRTHLHGAMTFEGRLTPFEFFHRLRRLGYLERRGLEADDPGMLLEAAIARLAEEGEIKSHLIIDRASYLEQLKSLYEKVKNN